MKEISTAIIKEAIYNLCFSANTCLNASIYGKIFDEIKKNTNNETQSVLKSILLNAKTAFDTKLPLCQDTGQVLVFLEIGQDVVLKGDFIDTVINDAIAECYKNNYFRKSVVKNAIFERINTQDNTPAIIHTKLVKGDKIKINVLIKGGGSENKSLTKMFLPTIDRDEIISSIGDMILASGVNACPPMFIGIGVGGTMEKASILSEEVFFKQDYSNQEFEMAENIKHYVNNKAPKMYENSYVLDMKRSSIHTHIACMPVAVTINCHSDRFSSCVIENNEVIYENKIPDFVEVEENIANIREIKTDEIDKIRSLREGERILLTGEIYVARDMVHKRLIELIEKGKKIPFDIKDKIIFYAGPCPAKDGEIIGSIGPTTASRMDKYAVKLYDLGMIATIGKGDRCSEVVNAIKKNGAKYFTVTGGIAALLAKKVTQAEIIAFEELGAEALYKLQVQKFPIKVEIG